MKSSRKHSSGRKGRARKGKKKPQSVAAVDAASHASTANEIPAAAAAAPAPEATAAQDSDGDQSNGGSSSSGSSSETGTRTTAEAAAATATEDAPDGQTPPLEYMCCVCNKLVPMADVPTGFNPTQLARAMQGNRARCRPCISAAARQRRHKDAAVAFFDQQGGKCAACLVQFKPAADDFTRPDLYDDSRPGNGDEAAGGPSVPFEPAFVDCSGRNGRPRGLLCCACMMTAERVDAAPWRLLRLARYLLDDPGVVAGAGAMPARSRKDSETAKLVGHAIAMDETEALHKFVSQWDAARRKAATEARIRTQKARAAGGYYIPGTDKVGPSVASLDALWE